MKLWVDDLRNPANHVGEGWTWAQTVREALEILATREVTHLSLDYDLEAGAYACATCQRGAACGAHPCGFAVVEWLAANPARWPTVVYLHSANRAGVIRMLDALRAMRWRVDPGVRGWGATPPAVP